MNTTLKLVTAALVAGTSMMAFAQTPKASFADMQAVSSNSSQWQQSKPQLSSQPTDPTAGLSVSDYQSLSSEGPEWHRSERGTTFNKGPTFAQTHPHGIPFAEYEALSSNGGEFKMPAAADTSSFAAKDTVNTAGGEGQSTLRERIASFFGRNGTPMQVK